MLVSSRPSTTSPVGSVVSSTFWLVLANESEGRLALPPHAFDGRLDPKLSALRLATRGMRVATGPLLTNSFGFGGNNCSLVLGRERG